MSWVDPEMDDAVMLDVVSELPGWQRTEEGAVVAS